MRVLKEKPCINCWTLIKQSYTCSEKEWNERRKFCSKKCNAQYTWKSGKWKTQFVDWHTPAMKWKHLPEEKKASMPHLLQKWHSNHWTEYLRKWRENWWTSWNKWVYWYHIHWWPILTRTNKSIRQCQKYLNWRNEIYKIDDYTCRICWERWWKLHVDHIKQFALIIKENNIKSLDEALICNELWDIDNWRTLCIDCHSKTETYQKPLK